MTTPRKKPAAAAPAKRTSTRARTPGTSRKITPKSIEVQEKRDQALRLRAKRWTYQAIAEELDFCDRGEAWRACQQAMSEIVVESAEEVRALELEQLDALYDALTVGIKAGDVQSIRAALKIQERRSALLGLDAPKTIHATGAPFSIAVDAALLPEGADLSGLNGG